MLWYSALQSSQVDMLLRQSLEYRNRRHRMLRKVCILPWKRCIFVQTFSVHAVVKFQNLACKTHFFLGMAVVVMSQSQDIKISRWNNAKLQLRRFFQTFIKRYKVKCIQRYTFNKKLYLLSVFFRASFSFLI